MNRELEKLLKEKWFLVAADLIAVLAILLVMPDKRDGLDTFLVICAILAASLIVVIPVLKDGGGKAERQAEQARLRAKLAEEIDLQRDNIRAGNEAMNRRIAEAETTARKAADKLEAALDALREEVAELRARPVASGEAETAAVSSPAAAAEESADEEESEEEEAIEESEDASEEAAAPAADEPAPSAAGSGTALIVNLMIGIGNKPFVRGTGPGLSRDKGVPMSFLGIGRWQWISPDPEAPATVEVWKNDQSPMGEALHLPGGEPVEVDEGHFGGV